MKTILYSLVTILFFSCAEPNPASTAVGPLPADTVVYERYGDETSVNVTGFLSFNKNTTYAQLVDYAAQNGLTLNHHPDFDRYFGDKGYAVEYAECPAVKHVEVEQLPFEALRFNHAIFSFQNDRLVTITLFVYGGINHLDFDELKSLYRKKYGEGYSFTSEVVGTMHYTRYVNKEDSVVVSFQRFIDEEPANLHPDLHERQDIFKIVFPNTIATECAQLWKARQAEEEQQKAAKEQEALDKI